MFRALQSRSAPCFRLVAGEASLSTFSDAFLTPVAHNHFPHSALTRYALGAPAKLLDDTWAHDEPHLAPLDPEGRDETGDLSRLPEAITRENWDDPSTLGFKE